MAVKIKVLIERCEGWFIATASDEDGQLARREGATEAKALKRLCRSLDVTTNDLEIDRLVSEGP